jgi:FkbM family methyltransferase
MTETATFLLRTPFDPTPFPVSGPANDPGVVGVIQSSGGLYEPEVMVALSRLLEPDSVVFDIGANIGVFALVMSRLAPRGRIYAFEPAPETFGYLVRNLEDNGAGNVTADPRAVYDEGGHLSFEFNPAFPSASFVSGAGDLAGGGGVEAVRLDDYVKEQGIDRVDLIMIDAEGAEPAVLRGAAGTIARHDPALLVEINPTCLRRVGHEGVRELVATLGRGRGLFCIQRDGGLARVMGARHAGKLLRREGVVDLLCLPKGRRAGRGTRRGASWYRGLRQMGRLELDLNAWRVPANDFATEPACALRLAAVEPVEGAPGETLRIPVEVRNTGSSWFSSGFPFPVRMFSCWLDAHLQLHNSDLRGSFTAPLAPGRSAVVELPVVLPPVAGTHEMDVSLVQDDYTWFHLVDPTLHLTVAVTVRPGPDRATPTDAR